MPMVRMREENFSGGGSIWGRALLLSAISSMSKKIAPGMCSSRYSARASLPSPGMYQVASMITKSGASSSASSSSASISHVFGVVKFSSPIWLDEHARCRRLDLIEPSGHWQPLFAQEFRVEQPSLIPRAVIAEHRDDGVAGSHVPCQADCAGDIDAARPAKAEAFLAQQVEHHGQRLRVGDLVGRVDLGPLQIGGDAALANPFGDGAAFRLELAVLVEIVERSPHRVGEADDNIGIVLLQPHRDAGQRATGADRADEAVDFAVEVAPNLLGRRLDVTMAIRHVVELVGHTAPFGSLAASSSASRPEYFT